MSAVLLDAKGATKRAGWERNFWPWPGRREGGPPDPIDVRTASPIQGCWIYINRAKDQTMKACVESPKDLGKGRKQSFRSPPNPRAFLAPTAIFPNCQYPLQNPTIEHSSRDLCVPNLIAWEA